MSVFTIKTSTDIKDNLIVSINGTRKQGTILKLKITKKQLLGLITKNIMNSVSGELLLNEHKEIREDDEYIKEVLLIPKCDLIISRLGVGVDSINLINDYFKTTQKHASGWDLIDNGLRSNQTEKGYHQVIISKKREVI